jgi:hypothetical protein
MYDRRRDLPGWHHLRDGGLVSKGGRGGRRKGTQLDEWRSCFPAVA